MNCTVIGGNGFIGSALVEYLLAKGLNVWVPEKGSPKIYDRPLGTVIYCAGNGDCENTPFKVVDSNVILLSSIIEKSSFERLIYISSTRLYINNTSSQEDADLSYISSDGRALFNLTKLTAEELCRKSKRNVLILRPSNVYGRAINSSLFLPMLIKNAINNKVIDMYVSPLYQKDYLSVYDLCFVIHNFISRGWSGTEIYNVASGENVSADVIAKFIEEKTGCAVRWHSGFTGESFPVINIDKLRSAMEFKARSVLNDLDDMIDVFTKELDKSE